MNKIITVDDDAGIRHAIVQILKSEGFAIDEAQDADDAWSKIQKERYNLVLLDIMMPGMSANKFIEYINGLVGVDPSFENIKIVYVSALPISDDERIKVMVDDRVCGYLDKPFTKDQLVTAVRQALGLEIKKVHLHGSSRIVEEGNIYLIKEEHRTGSTLLFEDEKKDNEGLIITRRNPEHIRSDSKLADSGICWLTDIKTDEYDTVSTLTKLAVYLEEHLTDGKIILIDCLDNIIAGNEFESVLRFIQQLRDRTSTTKSIILMPLNPKTIDSKKLMMLEKECKTIP